MIETKHESWECQRSEKDPVDEYLNSRLKVMLDSYPTPDERVEFLNRLCYLSGKKE